MHVHYNDRLLFSKSDYVVTVLYSMTKGYSASDLKSLASDASLGPIRGWDKLNDVYTCNNRQL